MGGGIMYVTNILVCVCEVSCVCLSEKALFLGLCVCVCVRGGRVRFQSAANETLNSEKADKT